MPDSVSKDPVVVAAAVGGAFAIVAARIQARMDSRLSDNELVTDAVAELAALALDKLDGRDTPGDNGTGN